MVSVVSEMTLLKYEARLASCVSWRLEKEDYFV